MALEPTQPLRPHPPRTGRANCETLLRWYSVPSLTATARAVQAAENPAATGVSDSSQRRRKIACENEARRSQPPLRAFNRTPHRWCWLGSAAMRKPRSLDGAWQPGTRQLMPLRPATPDDYPPRGPWSLCGGSRPAPLPSVGRRPCCQGAMQHPADEQIPLPPPAAIARAVAMAELASPQTWKPPARWILQCLSPPPETGSSTQRTMHGCVTGKSATGGAGLGGKTARALWKACEHRRMLVDGSAKAGVD